LKQHLAETPKKTEDYCEEKKKTLGYPKEMLRK
jgi:hypothetical protein